MPQIPIYQQQVQTGGLVQAPRAQGLLQANAWAEATPAVEQALGQVGHAAAQFAQYQENELRQQSELWATKAASDYDVKVAQAMDEIKKTSQPGANDTVPRIIKAIGDIRGKAMEDAPNPYTKRMLDAHLANTTERYTLHAMEWQNAQNKVYKSKLIGDSIYSASSKIATSLNYNDAEKNYEESAGLFATTIGSSDLEPDEKIALTQHAMKEFNDSFMLTVTEQDPEMWVDLLSKDTTHLPAVERIRKTSDFKTFEKYKNNAAVLYVKSLSQQNKMNTALEKQKEEDADKECSNLASQNKLTPDILETYREALKAERYGVFLAKITGALEKENPMDRLAMDAIINNPGISMNEKIKTNDIFFANRLITEPTYENNKKIIQVTLPPYADRMRNDIRSVMPKTLNGQFSEQDNILYNSYCRQINDYLVANKDKTEYEHEEWFRSKLLPSIKTTPTYLPGMTKEIENNNAEIIELMKRIQNIMSDPKKADEFLRKNKISKRDLQIRLETWKQFKGL